MRENLFLPITNRNAHGPVTKPNAQGGDLVTQSSPFQQPSGYAATFFRSLAFDGEAFAE